MRIQVFQNRPNGIVDELAFVHAVHVIVLNKIDEAYEFIRVLFGSRFYLEKITIGEKSANEQTHNQSARVIERLHRGWFVAFGRFVIFTEMFVIHA